MGGIDITERIRVQRACACGGMVLADKLAKQKPEPERIRKDDNPNNIRFGDVFKDVYTSMGLKFAEKTTK